MASKSKQDPEVRVAITQSNYMPWKGYFDLIGSVDYCVFLDDVQYTRRDWRNRNLIIHNGLQKWLSVPILSKGEFTQAINEARPENYDWISAHLQTIFQSYRKTSGYDLFGPIVREAYADFENKSLSEINQSSIQVFADYLGIHPKFLNSENFASSDGRTERLVEICISLGADKYVTGPAAKSYLDVSKFMKVGIDVEWFDYTGYPTYPQQAPTFTHSVSVLDLLFNVGHQYPAFMKSAGWRNHS